MHAGPRGRAWGLALVPLFPARVQAAGHRLCSPANKASTRLLASAENGSGFVSFGKTQRSKARELTDLGKVFIFLCRPVIGNNRVGAERVPRECGTGTAPGPCELSGLGVSAGTAVSGQITPEATLPSVAQPLHSAFSASQAGSFKEKTLPQSAFF